MVRDNRVKQYIFPLTQVNAANKGLFSEHVINGEINDITFTGMASAGSYYFTESGLGTNILSNSVASGTSTSIVYPRAFTNILVGGTTGSPEPAPIIVNGPIQFIASGLTSGTNNVIGPIYVRYR